MSGFPRGWERIERLSAAVLRMSAEHDLDQVLQDVADSARAVVGCSYAALGVLDEGGAGLARFVVSGISDEARQRIGALPEGKGVLGVLIQDPRPLRMRDLAAHAKAHGFPAGHPEMMTFLGVPVLGRAGPIGNLYLTEKDGGAEFTDEDEALAVMLASHAAVAVENARFIAEREMLNGELRRLQASRDRFFAMVNHELRNCLTAVHGWAELWLRQADPQGPPHPQEVFESAELAVQLLEDLLDLSRLDANMLRLKYEDRDLVDIVRDVARSVEPAAEQAGVRVAAAAGLDSVPCRIDPRRVGQVLVNLLNNAIRHSPKGGVVAIAVAAADGEITVEVADQGEGIAPEDQATIFEAFERAGQEAASGAGLGLALSRKLAQLMGGDLGFESARGEGARFRLTIPGAASS